MKGVTLIRRSVILGLLGALALPLAALAQGFGSRPGGPGGPGTPGGGLRPPQIPGDSSSTRRPVDTVKRMRREENLDDGLYAEIVARVDDDVILLADVIQPVRAQLQAAQKQLPPAKYREFERETLRRITQTKIERMVVIKELLTQVPDPSVLDRIRASGVKEFEKYLMEMARKNGFEDRDAIVAQLEKEGSNIETLREEFLDNMIAQSYLGQLLNSKAKEPTRAQLMRYYRKNLDDFRDEEGAVWSHIQVSFGGDQEAAQQKIEQASQELAAGADFADVAKKYSDGPTAVTGGSWSLTSRGSYADSVVDEALFSIPVGRVSPILTGANAYHIIKIDKRSDGSPKPFSEVQRIVRDALLRRGQQNLRQKKLDEIMKRHYVENVFDQAPAAMQARQTNDAKLR